MRVSICDSAAVAAAAVASTVVDQLALKPDLVLGLPTGRSSLGIYRELVRMHLHGFADFSRVHTVNLDEFIGLKSSDVRSYCTFMTAHLFSKVNIPRDHIHFLDGHARDIAGECERYEALIDSLGGIDLQLLGVGANGHIGFNEPGAALHARTHRARLRLSTRRANASLFAGRLRDVPREALSMGMATILEASSIVLIALGREKANAVATLVGGNITTASPVSFLQLHPEVHVILDRPAASKLPRPLREPNRSPREATEAPGRR